MTTVDPIEAAVLRLGRRARAELMKRLDGRGPGWDIGEVDENGDNDWDRQMIADVAAGKFDAMMAQAAAGRCRPWPRRQVGRSDGR